MRGPYFKRLVAVFRASGLKSPKLAEKLGVSQKTAWNWLHDEDEAKGGTIDLDDADDALRKFGSSLKEFVNDVPVPARPASKLPPTLETIVETLEPVAHLENGEDGLRNVLALARSVRQQVLRIKKRSSSRPRVGRSKTTESTGSTSRRQQAREAGTHRRG